MCKNNYCLIWLGRFTHGASGKVAPLRHLRDFDLSQPAVHAKLRERYGNSLPLNETVISPVSIFNSPELVTVLNK